MCWLTIEQQFIPALAGVSTVSRKHTAAKPTIIYE